MLPLQVEVSPLGERIPDRNAGNRQKADKLTERRHSTVKRVIDGAGQPIAHAASARNPAEYPQLPFRVGVHEEPTQHVICRCPGVGSSP